MAQKDPKRLSVSYMSESERKNYVDVLKLLPFIFGIPHGATFAKSVLNISAGMWGNIKNTNSNFPPDRLTILESRINEKFNSVVFRRDQLTIDPKEFVEIFRKEEIYEIIKNVAYPRAAEPAVEINKLLSTHKLLRFCGKFVGAYLCKDPSTNYLGYIGPYKEALAIDPYVISVDEDANSLRIEQIDNPFTPIKSIGRFYMNSDTIEIRIGQGNSQDPDAVYMASVPKGLGMYCYIAIGMDVKYGSRNVVARPTIFIKTDESEKEISSTTYENDTSIYKVAKNIISKYAFTDQLRLEFSINQEISEVDRNQIIHEIKTLRASTEEEPEEQ